MCAVGVPSFVWGSCHYTDFIFLACVPLWPLLCTLLKGRQGMFGGRSFGSIVWVCVGASVFGRRWERCSLCDSVCYGRLYFTIARSLGWCGRARHSAPHAPVATYLLSERFRCLEACFACASCRCVTGFCALRFASPRHS